VVGIVTYNWAILLGFLVGAVGLLFWAPGLVLWWEGRWRSDVFGLRGSGDHRDRLILGSALVLTAFLVVALFGEIWTDELFSDAASSVSNAPGP